MKDKFARDMERMRKCIEREHNLCPAKMLDASPAPFVQFVKDLCVEIYITRYAGIERELGRGNPLWLRLLRIQKDFENIEAHADQMKDDIAYIRSAKEQAR